MPEAISVFLSYAHEDEHLKDILCKHLAALQREGEINIWDDRKMYGGDEWNPVIKHEIESADIILLLISPSFISSKYIYENEIPIAMRRHERGEARVVPVILRDCDWQSQPYSKLQALPKDGKAITDLQVWSTQDKAFSDVAMGIRAIVQNKRASEPITDDKFQSHLEEQWAVFFRTLAIKYEYRSEKSELSNGNQFLPRFWLPQIEMWCLIKQGKPTHKEKEQALHLARTRRENVVILYGECREPVIIYQEQQPGAYNGHLFWGKLNSLGYSQFVWSLTGIGEPYNNEADNSSALHIFLRHVGVNAPTFDGTIESALRLINLDREWYLKEHHKDTKGYEFDLSQDGLIWQLDTSDKLFLDVSYSRATVPVKLKVAYIKATLS